MFIFIAQIRSNKAINIGPKCVAHFICAQLFVIYAQTTLFLVRYFTTQPIICAQFMFATLLCTIYSLIVVLIFNKYDTTKNITTTGECAQNGQNKI